MKAFTIKRLALCGLLVAVLLLSAASLAQLSVPAYQKVELQCQICGKTLYEKQAVQLQPEFPQYFDNMPFSSSGWDGYPSYVIEIPDSLIPRIAERKVTTGKLCIDCYLLCVEQQDALEVRWNKWWLTTMQDNAESRERYDKQRKIAAAEAIEAQIKELRKKKKEIFNPPKPVEPSTWNLDSLTYTGSGRRLSFDTVAGFYGVDSLKTLVQPNWRWDEKGGKWIADPPQKSASELQSEKKKSE